MDEGAVPPAPPFEIGGAEVAPGTREDIEIPVERLATGPWISLPLIVVHGRRPGPAVVLTAALHGDEINGVEIIRRLLAIMRAEEIAGTLLAVPVVNELGFIHGDRYLPDRRDLNRSFPGSERGSLAARIAHLVLHEIVMRCELAIDLHCGSDGRANLPQIRADLRDERTLAYARAFAAAVTIDAPTRDRSLREAASEAGVATLLYEGGESGRYDEYAIVEALGGVLRVLDRAGMAPPQAPATSRPTAFSHATRWVRASRGGLMRLEINLGDTVEHRQTVAQVSDIYGRRNLAVRASIPGIVVGANQSPMVNQGDALVHIAAVDGGDERTRPHEDDASDGGLSSIPG